MFKTKVLAISSLAVVLVGCSNTASNPSEALKVAMQKTAHELAQVHSDTNLDFTVALKDNGGAVKVNLAAAMDASNTKEGGDMTIGFSAEGAVKDMIAAEGMPEAASVKIGYVRNAYDIYLKLSNLKLVPAQMQTLVESVAGDYLDKNFVLKLKDLYAQMGVDMTGIDFTKNGNMYDTVLNSLAASPLEDGQTVGVEKAKAILDAVLGLEYLDVKNVAETPAGTEYTVTPNVPKMIEIFHDLTVANLKSAEEKADFEEAMKEAQPKINEFLAGHDLTKDLQAVVTVKNGFVVGFSLSGSIAVDDAEAKIEKVDVNFSQKLSKINEDFYVEVPKDAIDLVEMFGAYLTLGQGGDAAPVEDKEPASLDEMVELAQ